MTCETCNGKGHITRPFMQTNTDEWYWIRNKEPSSHDVVDICPRCASIAEYDYQCRTRPSLDEQITIWLNT